MRCQEFDRQMADWVNGRLQAHTDEEMTQHAAKCASCAEEAEIERSLRAAFRTVAPIRQTPDLWERIEARVAYTKQPRFVLPFRRPLALSGALAAGVLLVVMVGWGPRNVSVVPGEDPARVAAVVGDDKPGVLDKLQTIRMTDTDPVGSYGETPSSGEAAHLLLVSSPGR